MNPEKKTFYITTPIYYPSDKLHIGHTYCTVATDAMARYKRLTGYDVMFLTGTDEHGQKIEDKAREAGVSPKEFVDRIVEGPQGVKDLWKLMNISNDRFIRTTDDYHVSAIQKIFKAMYDNGDIYKGKYVGKYCKPCESFWTESQLKDGCCPDCGRPVVDAEEELPGAPQPGQRDGEQLHQARPGGSVRLPHLLHLGCAGGLRPRPRGVRVGGRPVQLHDRPGLHERQVS